MNSSTLAENAFLVYDRMLVKAVGKQNAISPHEISGKIWPIDTYLRPDRFVRQRAYEIIAYIRSEWDIVCEINMGRGAKGYFIPATAEEAEEYLARTGAGIGTRAKNWNNQRARALHRFPELDVQITLNLYEGEIR